LWHSYRADCAEDLQLLGIHFDWFKQHDTLQFPLFFAAEDSSADESLFRVTRSVPDWDEQRRPYLDFKAASPLRSALEEIVIEYSIGTEEARFRAGAMLVSAIVLMSRAARLTSQNEELQRVGHDAARRVEKARVLLESEELHSVEKVAAQVQWSADHLRRMFRAVYGISPNAAQTAFRLQRARTLLRQDNLSVADIAQRCGFDNSDYFVRWFKAESGWTPRQFRAMSRQENG
jgi:AraC-like DNA-binding protein